MRSRQTDELSQKIRTLSDSYDSAQTGSEEI